ncbi:MAG: WhiB family transcriptional regulator [Ilumatobacteraceae bacterium]
MLPSDQQAWRSQAACLGLDTNLFFPERGEPTAGAKAVCAICPVRIPCGDWATFTNEPLGIWGGLNRRERKARRRQLAIQPIEHDGSLDDEDRIA